MIVSLANVKASFGMKAGFIVTIHLLCVYSSRTETRRIRNASGEATGEKCLEYQGELHGVVDFLYKL